MPYSSRRCRGSTTGASGILLAGVVGREPGRPSRGGTTTLTRRTRTNLHCAPPKKRGPSAAPIRFSLAWSCSPVRDTPRLSRAFQRDGRHDARATLHRRNALHLPRRGDAVVVSGQQGTTTGSSGTTAPRAPSESSGCTGSPTRPAHRERHPDGELHQRGLGRRTVREQERRRHRVDGEAEVVDARPQSRERKAASPLVLRPRGSLWKRTR